MPKSLLPNTFDYAGIYVNGKRTYFPVNKPVLGHCLSGTLVPLGDAMHIIPGAKVELLLDLVIRSNTMIVPPLDGIFCDTFCVWVPHRIVFNSMPQFLGENDSTAWTQAVEVVYPMVKIEELSNDIYSDYTGEDINDVDIGNVFLAPHYGHYVHKQLKSGDAAFGVEVNVLQYRGYYSAWNYFFRDENYQRPVLFSKGNNGKSGEFGYALFPWKVANNDTIVQFTDDQELGASFLYNRAMLMPVCKFHDFATSVLPEPQFGDPVEFGLSGQAEVKLDSVLTEGDSGNGQILLYSDGTASEGGTLAAEATGFLADYPGDDAGQLWLNPNGSLYADLNTASATTVNQLRSAVMYQRYLEALARGGRRVVEYYESIYGVRNSVARKDYPEMMSHQRFMLGVNQVIATADGSGDGWTSHLGDTGAFSLTDLRNIPLCKGEFTEFGYLHFFLCIRAENRYSMFIPKHSTYKSLMDVYNPYFDHIGDVDVPNYLVNSLAKNKGNFGYQEAWWEERSSQGITWGSLNKNYGSLSYWTIGEEFDKDLITCTPEFLCFNPSVFDSLFVSDYTTYPQFILDTRIHGRTAKRMSLHSIPGIVGRI